MRIIAGSLSGRIFSSPHGHRTHPMGDKVRGALFNALGDIDGLEVLDAFTGSGALSFEAASRGAEKIVAIDNDRSAQLTIDQNVKSLDLSDKIKLIRAAAGSWLDTSDASFDLVLLDPPYDNLQPGLLQRLADRSKPGGTVVLSLPPKSRVSLDEKFTQLSVKEYGDATLNFYRRVN